MWVGDMLDDVESDLSVFHRIDDVDAVDAARFFRLSERLPAYQGAVRARLEIEAAAQQPTPPQQPAPATSPGRQVSEVPAEGWAKSHAGFRGDDRNPPVFGPAPKGG